MVQKKKNKFDESMLDFICCPKCQSDLNYDEKTSILICVKCKYEYIVKNGIPILLEQ